ncbi:hypothetical protein ABKN59_001370 [Abortiporus biennis]
MPIVQRYTLAAEYAELITTAPRRRTKHSNTNTWSTISKEASSWYEAVPSSKDMQDVVQRVQSNSQLTQHAVFTHIYPFVIFGFLFAFAYIVLDPNNTYIQSIVSDPFNHLEEIEIVITGLGTTIVGALVFLRLGIWGVAEGVDRIIKRATPAGKKMNTDPLPEIDILIGDH